MLTKDDPPLTLAQKRNSSFVWTGGEVSRHDIAAIWVAFFSRWQRYRCSQGYGGPLTATYELPFSTVSATT